LAGVWARGASEKIGTPYVFLQPLKLATSNLVHKLVLGLAYQKTTFSTKIGGGLGQGSIRKKFGTLYVFLQPLKLAASNTVHKLGLGLAYQKPMLRTKIGGGRLGEHPKKIWDPVRISATVEANKFKCCTQIGFGTSLAKKQHLRPRLEGVWARGTSEKNWDPYVFLQPLKLPTSNLVYNLVLGLAYQKQRFGSKLAGVWAREPSKKFGTPYLFLQPLKLATANLVQNFGLGLPYQKTTFRTKIGGAWARGASGKIWDPLFISAND